MPNSGKTSHIELVVWRIYVILVCTVFFGPLIGILLGVSGFPSAGMAMFILAAACAAIVVVLLILGGFMIIASLFRHGPPARSLYPYYYGWRWHRRWWPL